MEFEHGKEKNIKHNFVIKLIFVFVFFLIKLAFKGKGKTLTAHFRDLGRMLASGNQVHLKAGLCSGRCHTNLDCFSSSNKGL